MNELNNVSNTITSLKQNDLLNVILHGDKNFDSNSNQSILTATIKSTRYSKRFDKPLFWAILLTILDNPVYNFFSRTLLFFNFNILLFIISGYEEIGSEYFCIARFYIAIKLVFWVVYCHYVFKYVLL